MATRTIEATLDKFSVDAGSEVTYLGPTAAGNKGDAIRGFRVNPGSTGDIKVTIDRSEGVNTIQIFQEDAFATGSAPTGYFKFFDIENINYHKKRIDFKNHLKFFISKKHAERVLRKLQYLKQQKRKRGYIWEQ
jgi:hypothetical protein